ncbi:MAG: septal ring lytic transglycosylase RlpA family protein [Saprospiraceae bacterium]|nr:septal ring lytic transglycosylase RlpA family protein [Saprospiraceae bacterium]
MKKPFKAGLITACFLLVNIGFVQSQEYGKASFYDDSFQGSLTAYGVKYDKNELTASHKIHPFGTILRVTRVDNKKSVDVKVIDKGPYLKGRVVDLSRRAAAALGMLDEGVADVRIDVIKKASGEVANTTTPKTDQIPAATEKRPENYSDETTRNSTPQKVANNSAAKETPKEAVALTEKKANTPQKLATTKDKQTSKVKLVGKDYAPYDLYQIQLLRPAKKGYGVQVASLISYENVLRQVADLQAKSFDTILMSVEKGKDTKPVYKIILGNYTNEAQAESYKKDLKRRYKIDGFVVDLSTTQY